MTFLLCDPSWYVHMSDVRNKQDDNTHTQIHTESHPSSVYSNSAMLTVGSCLCRDDQKQTFLKLKLTSTAFPPKPPAANESREIGGGSGGGGVTVVMKLQ